ncbi:MAG: ABC transporter substrate-binding protein [Saccharofermentanales bacterium]
MRKKIGTLLVIISIIGTLLFPGNSSATIVMAQENQEPVTINYWSIYPSSDPYTVKHQIYLDKFMEKNKNIKIVHQGTNFWDYFTKLKTAQAGGDVIDVYWQDIVSVKFRAKNEVAANLSPYLNADNVDMTQWTKNDLDTVTYQKGIYAMIFSSDSRVLYYNKAHMKAAGLDPESPPDTFEQLKDYAQKLTIYENADKKKLIQVGFHPRLGNNAIQQIVWPMGGSFFDKNGNPTINIEANVKAIQWWVDIARSYPLRAMNGFTSEHSDGTGKDQSFIQGAASMVIDGDWLAWQIEKINPDLDYGVTAVPYTKDEYRSNWSGGFTLEMSAKSDDKKARAAWEFMKYMTGIEVQSDMSSKLDFLPANTKAIEELKKTANANQKLIFNEFNYRRHVDYCEASPEWWIYVQEQLSKAEGNEDTAKVAMDTAQTNLLAVIDEYNITNQGTDIPVIPIILGASGVALLIAVIILLKSRAKRKSAKK